MATWRVNNSTVLGGEVCSQWQANHAYSEGARCVCTTAYGTTSRRGYVFECTTAGTSHATTEPTWGTSGTVSDGTVTWTVRSPNDGSWDNASCILHYVLNHTAIAAGDTVYIDDGHSEAVTIGATTAYTILGSATKNNPHRILCVDKATDALSSGAVIDDTQTSATYPMRLTNYFYSYGVTYKSATHIGLYSGSEVILENCGITLASAKELRTYSSSLGSLVLMDCDITFLAADAFISCGSTTASTFIWRGGSVVAASGVTTLLKSTPSYGSRVYITGVDVSAIGNNILFTINNNIGIDIVFTRCKLPATFTAISGDFPKYFEEKLRLHHCSSDNATYDFYETGYCGVVSDETTVVRTGGASDGTTPLSMKMVSSADTKEQFIWLEAPTVNTWTTSAASQTVTVEFVHDSATALQNDEIWLEVEYPADNTSGLGAIATSRCAILGTPADTTDSSVEWTTTGLSNPNTRKLAVTIDPGKVGPITARVCLAKASTTVYVDPLITIT